MFLFNIFYSYELLNHIRTAEFVIKHLPLPLRIDPNLFSCVLYYLAIVDT